VLPVQCAPAPEGVPSPGAALVAPVDRRPARRFGPAVVTTTVVVAVAVWACATQVGAISLDIPAVADWPWAVVASIAWPLSFPAAAAVLLAVTPVPVSAQAAVATQLAGAATKLVIPASIGAIGLNVRLLSTHGASLPVAIAAVAASQVAQVVVTVAALPVVLLGSDSLAAIPWDAVSGWWLLVAAVPVAGMALLAPVRSGVLAAWRRSADALRPLVGVLRSPERVLLGWRGAWD
jgi:glycosyltransferase 2 family protein